MTREFCLTILAAIIVAVLLLGNRKVRLFVVFKTQLKVLKNAKNEKISVWDIVCFIILPVVLAIILSVGLGCVIDATLANVLTTVFAFVFTVLFGFAAILVSKLEGNNKIEQQVVAETFVSIISSTILSLFSAIISLILIKVKSEIGVMVLSLVVYSFSFTNIMLLLLIIKRTFIIYTSNYE